MRILLFRTYPSVLDPTSYNCQELGLARAFLHLGHVCEVAYWGGRAAYHTQLVKAEGRPSVLVHWLPGRNLLKNGLFDKKWMFALLPQYDMIQVGEYDQWTSWRLYHSGRWPVALYHGPYASEFTKGYNLKCRVFDLFCNRPAKNANVTAFAKSQMAAEFLRGKGFAQAQAVGVGLEPSELGAAYQPPEPRPADTPLTLLYIGVLEERRSIPLLFEILEKLPDARLVLVGRGEEKYQESCFAAAKAAGVWARVEYHERLPQKQLPALYRRADLFLLPTQYEIFGMVLLEAMYFGLPALTSPNGGSDMLIENGVDGVVLPELTAEAYAEAAQRLAQDEPARLAMGRAAHQKIEEQFHWEQIATQMLAGYHRQLAAKGEG